MPTGLASLIATGTKLWLDSVDPDLVREARAAGATGATSNPVIISDLIKTGRFDRRIAECIARGDDDHTIAWRLADDLVRGAQEVFLDVWKTSGGNNGWVSFELDPLLDGLRIVLAGGTTIDDTLHARCDEIPDHRTKGVFVD